MNHIGYVILSEDNRYIAIDSDSGYPWATHGITDTGVLGKYHAKKLLIKQLGTSFPEFGRLTIGEVTIRVERLD